MDSRNLENRKTAQIFSGLTQWHITEIGNITAEIKLNSSLSVFLVRHCQLEHFQRPLPSQPCIPVAAKSVPALARVDAGMSPLLGNRCDPTWHASSPSGEVITPSPIAERSL